MVPATAAPPGPVTLKVAEVSVAGFIAVLKVTLIAVFKATFVAPLAGIVDTTAGPVTTSSPHPAMKVAIRATSKQLIPTGPFRIFIPSCNCGEKIQTLSVRWHFAGGRDFVAQQNHQPKFLEFE
jgi:hypothetical protein